MTQQTNTTPLEAPQEPDPAPVEVSPEAALLALEAHLARLRDEREAAEHEAGAALARANRASVALIAASKQRSALRQQLERQSAA
jgi:hypothetical protein